jgi:phosphatidylglycerophosphatase A
LKIIIELLSTIFFVGYLPASGTFATLASFPVVILILKLNFVYQLIIIFVSILFSIFLSTYAEKVFSKKDDSKIVIDEFIGFLVTSAGLDVSNIQILLIAFLLFRIFDILKFGIINKLQNLPGGLGVMADDIFAGIITNFVIRLFF